MLHNCSLLIKFGIVHWCVGELALSLGYYTVTINRCRYVTKEFVCTNAPKTDICFGMISV